MQHIKTLAAAFILLIVTASCKKENMQTPPPVQASSKRIIEVKNQTNGDFTKYNYDAQGKVVKVESATHSWNMEYLPSIIKVTRKRIADNKVLGTDEYTVDATGRMISSVSKSATGVITYTYEYEYDAAGYMIRMKEIYDNGEVYEDFVTNPGGNPVTIKNYYNGTLNDVTDYYYNENVKNIGAGAQLLTNYGIKGFTGKTTEREISEFKRFGPSGTLQYHKVNTFTTDAEGWIIKYKATYPLTGMVHNWDVTYQ